MLKSQKGITLVALVITIIVLLILAGVTISLVLNNGLIDRAENSVQQYDDKSKNEMQQLNHAENLFNAYYTNLTTQTTTPDTPEGT